MHTEKQEGKQKNKRVRSKHIHKRMIIILLVQHSRIPNALSKKTTNKKKQNK